MMIVLGMMYCIWNIVGHFGDDWDYDDGHGHGHGHGHDVDHDGRDGHDGDGHDYDHDVAPLMCLRPVRPLGISVSGALSQLSAG